MVDFVLLTSQINSDKENLMDKLEHELHNDVKDLLLPFHADPRLLIISIS